MGKRVLILLLVVLPVTAHAYVGPGAGITFIGAVFGLLAGILLSIGLVLLWPIRMLLRSIRGKRDAAEAPKSPEAPVKDAAATEAASSETANPAQPSD